MKYIAILVFLAFSVAPAYAAKVKSPELSFDRVIFEFKDGKLIAPLATHMPAEDRQERPGARPVGWTPAGDDDYIAFDSDTVFPKDEGTLDIKLTVLGFGPEKKPSLTLRHEALVTLYDANGVAFFTVGMNDHDLTVGSFPLHPLVMEGVFGGIAFAYLDKLDAPLKAGTEMAITVKWGEKPSDNKVFVNGKLIEARSKKGSLYSTGKGPGPEPKARLDSFLNGFEGNFNGRENRKITPPKTLVIGRMGAMDNKNKLDMAPPKSVAIRSVRISSMPEPPVYE